MGQCQAVTTTETDHQEKGKGTKGEGGQYCKTKVARHIQVRSEPENQKL